MACHVRYKHHDTCSPSGLCLTAKRAAETPARSNTSTDPGAACPLKGGRRGARLVDLAQQHHVLAAHDVQPQRRPGAQHAGPAASPQRVTARRKMQGIWRRGVCNSADVTAPAAVSPHLKIQDHSDCSSAFFINPHSANCVLWLADGLFMCRLRVKRAASQE